MNIKQATRNILDHKPHQLKEYLKYMTEEEQERAYKVFLSKGNYDSKKTFLNVFSEDIFCILTGSVVYISETDDIHTAPLLTEADRKQGSLATISGLIDLKTQLSECMSKNKEPLIERELLSISYDLESVIEKLQTTLKGERNG